MFCIRTFQALVVLASHPMKKQHVCVLKSISAKYLYVNKYDSGNVALLPLEMVLMGLNHEVPAGILMCLAACEQ